MFCSEVSLFKDEISVLIVYNEEIKRIIKTTAIMIEISFLESVLKKFK